MNLNDHTILFEIIFCAGCLAAIPPRCFAVLAPPWDGVVTCPEYILSFGKVHGLVVGASDALQRGMKSIFNVIIIVVIIRLTNCV